MWLLARGFRGGTPQGLRRSVECGDRAHFRSGCLHALEHAFELCAMPLEPAHALGYQRLKFVHRNQDGTGRIMLGDSDRPITHGLVKNARELILELGSGNGMYIDQLAQLGNL